MRNLQPAIYATACPFFIVLHLPSSPPFHNFKINVSLVTCLEPLTANMADPVGKQQHPRKVKSLKLQAWLYEKALLFILVAMLVTEPIVKRF